MINSAKTTIIIGSIIMGILIVGMIDVITDNKDLKNENKTLQSTLVKKDNLIKSKDNKIKSVEEELNNSKKEVENLKNENSDLKKTLNEEVGDVNLNTSNLMIPSNVSKKRLARALEGTNLANLADTIVDAENETGVNALFLTALIAQESAWGTSNRAVNHNNLTGMAVYSPRAKGARYGSKEENIKSTAKHLVNEYLSRGGKYFKGTDIYAVNETYCTTGGYSWADNISLIAYDIQEKINKG